MYRRSAFRVKLGWSCKPSHRHRAKDVGHGPELEQTWSFVSEIKA